MSDALRPYYASRAPEYDAVYAKPERQPDLRAIERWLPSVFRDSSLLEIAAGTGYWTQFLAPVAQSLVAIDAAPETLAIARSRVAAAHVQFIVGDVYRLPFGERAFDGAFAGFWLSHVPRARARDFLLGLHDALRPGARVVFLDNRFVASSSTPIADRDDDGNTYQQRRLADGSTHRVLKNFPSETELRAMLAGIGADIRFHAWQHYWALQYTVVASHLVFVFGTLKEGFPNFATNRGTRVPGVFRTAGAYPLYLVGERHVPWMIDAPGQGTRVAGQLFRVDDETLAAMDRLERVQEPDGYHRARIALQDADGGTVLAHAYLKRPGLLLDEDIRLGPLAEYGADHARLYRPRS